MTKISVNEINRNIDSFSLTFCLISFSEIYIAVEVNENIATDFRKLCIRNILH